MPNAPYSIRFPKAVRARLDRLAATTERPVAFFVNLAVEHGQSIDVMEANYLSEAAREAARTEDHRQDLGKELNLVGNQMSLV